MTESPLLKQARDLLRKWMARLFLSHREIVLLEHVLDHSAAAKTYTNAALTQMVITINPQVNWSGTLKKTVADIDEPVDLEETIVHEGLHGHTVQIIEAIDAARENMGDYWHWRTKADVEKFVDEVARMLVGLDHHT